MSKFLIALSLCLSVLSANPQYNSLIAMQENAYGIPAHLLRAVSNIESGRAIGGSIAAWPWTANVEGKGYIYNTKQEAIKAVEKFQRMGAKSIDVGIMQINLRHHPHAFHNLEEAFDPQLNIAYGAKFLKQLFQQHKSWNSAVGHYHSATPKFHNAYKQRVLSNWMKLSGSNSNKNEGPCLEQTVMHLDDNSDLKKEPKITKSITSSEIRPFAKAKKVYYSLNGNASAHSMNAEKTSYALENASGRQYYSLD